MLSSGRLYIEVIRYAIVYCNLLKPVKHSVKRLFFAPAPPHMKCVVCAITPVQLPDTLPGCCACSFEQHLSLLCHEATSAPVGTSFLGEVFQGFSSPVRQMLGSFRPPKSPNIIWPSLSSILIHYGRQWPEMLMRPKSSNIHTNRRPRSANG